MVVTGVVTFCSGVISFNVLLSFELSSPSLLCSSTNSILNQLIIPFLFIYADCNLEKIFTSTNEDPVNYPVFIFCVIIFLYSVSLTIEGYSAAKFILSWYFFSIFISYF